MTRRIIFCIALAGAASLSVGPARGQSYTFLRITDERTLRPDGKGIFFPVSPTMEGDTVVFNQGRCFGCMSLDSIWAANLVTGSLTKLVDVGMNIPGSAMQWNSFESGAVLRKGVVVFIGYDANNKPGLYAVPAAGGAVLRLADTSTAVPGAGVNFTSFEPRMFFHDGTAVVFAAQGPPVAGVYSIRVDGTGLARVADSNTPVNSNTCDVFSVQGYTRPTVSNGLISYYGQTGFDASNGYNGLFLGPLAKTVNPNCAPFPTIANSLQNLPGNSNARFHTRYHYGLLDGTTLYYSADDANGAFAGIFSVPAVASPAGGNSTRIADTNTTLPDYGPVVGTNNFTFATDQGNVLFHSYDSTLKKTSLFLTRAGAAMARIVGTGDPVNGYTVVSVDAPQPGAISGTDFAFAWSRSDFYRELDVARLVSPAVKVTGVSNSASYQNDAISPGEVVTVFGTGLGPSNLGSGFVGAGLDANGLLASQLSGARILFNGFPAPLVYVAANGGAQASAIVPFEVASQTTAMVTAEYQGSVSAPFPIKIAAATPGLYSADNSGHGEGAILNPDGSYNSASNPAVAGSLITVFGTGVGQTNPPGVDGQISSATPPKPSMPVSVTIGGIAVTGADIVYQGDAPQVVEGLYQMNLRIPAGLPSGAAPVVLTVGGAMSVPDLTVAVK